MNKYVLEWRADPGKLSQALRALNIPVCKCPTSKVWCVFYSPFHSWSATSKPPCTDANKASQVVILLQQDYSLLDWMRTIVKGFNWILYVQEPWPPPLEMKKNLKGNENERTHYHKLLTGDNVLQEDTAFLQDLIKNILWWC